MAVAIRGIIA